MVNESLLDKLRKVLAIAQSGEAGERDAAKNLLDRLLADNGLTMDDLSDNRKEKIWLKLRRAPEMRSLMLQIYFMVSGESHVEYWECKATQEVAFMLTKIQAAQMRELYSVYAPALEKELKKARDVATRAFLLKNDIGSGKVPESDRKLTPEEMRELLAVFAYAENINKTNIYRQIEAVQQ